MGIPLNILTQQQRFWYAQMIVAAILADEEITQPETEFIKQILPIIKRPEDRQELTNRIANRQPPKIFRPPGVAPKVLAAVFIEMALVLISDVEFSDVERQFLENTARVFRFTRDYYDELLEWCEEGLDWKNRQLDFVSAVDRTDSLKVPVSKLNPVQQRWYAETLISSIMSDQQLDVAEVGFLKMAISLIKDDTQRNEVTNLVRRHQTPKLRKPPDMPKQTLIRIFIEVMLIISADESLDKKEQNYLQELAIACDFSESLFKRLVQWCIQGIKWKRAKNPLINRCRIDFGKGQQDLKLIRGGNAANDKVTVTGDEGEENEAAASYGGEAEPESPQLPDENETSVETEPLPEVEDNPENNSITNFNMDCYVCNSRLSVKFFLLKEKSQKPRHNIFGIPNYQIAADGFDQIDYNLCKVAVCSQCFFASPQKEMFRLKPTDQPPRVLNSEEFKQQWLESRESNRDFFRDHLEELHSIHRSIEAAVKTYQAAIKASTLLAEANNSHEIAWHTITLRLTFAQVLVEHGKRNEADALLKQIQKRSIELFKNVRNRFVTFRSGRLIILISLFFGDSKTASRYYDFFKTFREKKYSQILKEDQMLFQRVFGEIKRAMETPETYHKDNLNGYMLPSRQ